MPEIRREYGVVSPNGQVHWGVFVQLSLATEEGRSQVSITLHNLERELGFNENEFVNQFQWTSRVVTEEETRITIDEPSVISSPQQAAPVVPSTLTLEPIKASSE